MNTPNFSSILNSEDQKALADALGFPDNSTPTKEQIGARAGDLLQEVMLDAPSGVSREQLLHRLRSIHALQFFPAQNPPPVLQQETPPPTDTPQSAVPLPPVALASQPLPSGKPEGGSNTRSVRSVVFAVAALVVGVFTLIGIANMVLGPKGDVQNSDEPEQTIALENETPAPPPPAQSAEPQFAETQPAESQPASSVDSTDASEPEKQIEDKLPEQKHVNSQNLKPKRVEKRTKEAPVVARDLANDGSVAEASVKPVRSPASPPKSSPEASYDTPVKLEFEAPEPPSEPELVTGKSNGEVIHTHSGPLNRNPE